MEKDRSWGTCLRSFPFSRRNRELRSPDDGIGAGRKNHRAPLRHRIPCRSVVNHCRRAGRARAVQACRWAAEQAAVSNYRQVPLLLVGPFSNLLVGAERHVDRTYHLGAVRRMYGRVGGQGKGDGCHDDDSSGPVRVDWRCLDVGSYAWEDYGCCVDAMVVCRSVCGRCWRRNSPNAQIRREISTFACVIWDFISQIINLWCRVSSRSARLTSGAPSGNR
jgi:hypothetical protein